ncbi:MAG: hypothetical protein AAFU63_02845 [Pseudomonadota bacterium]
MTTANHLIKDAKDYVDKASAGAGKMATWVKDTQKMAKAGEELSELESIVSTLTFFSKLSGALQVVSVGLSIVQAFLPIKSKEDQILDAIGQLSTQISTMEQKISAELTAIQDAVWTASEQTALENKINDIDTALGYMAIIANLRRKTTLTKAEQAALATAESNLMGYGEQSLKQAVNEIERYVTGKALGKNILQLVFTESYGDPRRVFPLAGYLLHYAQMGLAANAAIRELKGRTGATQANPWTEADSAAAGEGLAGDPRVGSSYAALIQNVADQAQSWSQKCIDETERLASITRCFDDTAPAGYPLNAKGNQATAAAIFTRLSQQWPWLNFTVLCYDEMGGFDHHAFRTDVGNRLIHKLHIKDVSGDKMNVIIYVAPRTKPGTPTVLEAWQAEADKTQPYRHAIDSIGSMLNQHKRFGFSVWAQENVDDLRPFIVSYTMLTHPARLNQLGHELFWMAWNDRNEMQDLNDAHKDSFIGLMSQNPATLYKHYNAVPVPHTNGAFELYYTGYYALSVRDDAM